MAANPIDEPPAPMTPGSVSPVVAAAHVWADSLIDKTGRNELLFCKDRGKLLLDDADPDALARMLRSQPVRLRQLFADPKRFADASKSTEAIRRRIKEYDEERGVRVGRVVFGFATWRDARAKVAVRAPLLLRDVVITRRHGRDDYEIEANRDLEINPVLLHYVRSTFQVTPDPDTIATLNDVIDDPDRVAEGIEQLRALLADVPELQISPGVLIGTFHYAKLAMHDDLVEHAETFAESDLVAAMAGDPAAVERIRRPVGEVSLAEPDLLPPADEYLVLDADPSQNLVINAVLAGRNLVVQGPPGTGKSQTISNLISTLAARGQTVLFVAEKRAAIDAVLTRLDRVGLGDLTLDLHVTTANRSKVYEQFLHALEAAATVPPIDATRQQAQLERARTAMVAHDAAMHVVRPPWGVTFFDAQATQFAAAEEERPDVELSDGALEALIGARLDTAREALSELAAVDGFAPAASRGAWAGATFSEETDANRARTLVRELRTGLEPLRAAGGLLARSVGVGEPESPTAVGELAGLAERTRAVSTSWQPEIYGEDIGRLLAATGSGAYRDQVGISIGWFARRRLRKHTAALRMTPSADLHADLAEAADVMTAWSSRRVPVPAAVDGREATTLANAARARFAELGALIARPDLAAQSWDEVTATLADLGRDAAAPSRAARINRARAGLGDLGLEPLVRWLSDRAPMWPAERKVAGTLASFDALWNASIVRHTLTRDPHLASFDGAAHDLTVADFQRADRDQFTSAQRRVRRLAAERLTDTRSRLPDQDRFLVSELRKKRRLKPLRDLVQAAPDVLLAAKPCWAMSPLLVSQLLPPRQLFDVVIFDEASQVRPAEAITSLARGRAAVVAGDSKQLPPTTFFESTVEEDDAVLEERDLLTDDVESVLESFGRALGGSSANEFYLAWHYRSQDARLIAPSNAFFYDNRMTTFPSTAVASPLEFIEVVGAESKDGTSPSEVERVVDLMLEHARVRPEQSLGVITMGITHATRIEDALHKRLKASPDLRAWFDEPRPEPYFVKNLERVQGDERDAIILALGYGKSGGRMMYRFGPVNVAGGHRRLNVAISRAKRRMTVVAGFSPDELDPAKLNSEGARRLRDYLRYVAGGSVGVSESPVADRPLNPFEAQVRERLAEAGIDVECQVGVAGYFLDFAAKHPTRPGRLVLAIEGDGASYHAAPTARSRDRLRQEQLERLGWRFHRIWSTDWFRDPDRELTKLKAAYDEAVAAADAADVALEPPVVEAPPDETTTAEAAVVEAPPGEAAPVGAAVAAAAEAAQGETVPIEVALADQAPADPALAEVPPDGAESESARGPRPDIVSRDSIDDYDDAELRDLVEWIASDGRLRTDVELKQAIREELGFKRSGTRIDARLTAVVAAFHAR